MVINHRILNFEDFSADYGSGEPCIELLCENDVIISPSPGTNLYLTSGLVTEERLPSGDVVVSVYRDKSEVITPYNRVVYARELTIRNPLIMT